MKVNEIVELVFLRVNGHKPSTDSSILRSDIRALLPAAINYALDAAYNINIKTDGDRDLPSEFYAYHEVNLDTSGDRPFFELVKPVVPLKGNAGLRFVIDACGRHYTPVPDYAMPNLEYYSKLAICMGWFRQTGNKVELYGSNPLITKISYQGLEKTESLQDDDEAPIQAGLESTVMNLLADWLLGAKQTPYDSVSDGRDIVNAAK